MNTTRILDKTETKERILEKALLSRGLMKEEYKKPVYLMKKENVIGQLLELSDSYCKQSIYSLPDFITSYYQQKYPSQLQHSKHITMLFYSLNQQLLTSNELNLINQLFQITVKDDDHVLLKFYLKLRKQTHTYLSYKIKADEYFEDELLSFQDWSTIIGRVFKSIGIIEIGNLIRDYNTKAINQMKEHSIPVIPFFRLCINYFNKNRSEILYEQEILRNSFYNSFISKNRQSSQHNIKSFTQSLPIVNDFKMHSSAKKCSSNTKSLQNSTISIIDESQKKVTYEQEDQVNIYRYLNKSNDPLFNNQDVRTKDIIIFDKQVDDYFRQYNENSYSANKYQSSNDPFAQTREIISQNQQILPQTAQTAPQTQVQIKQILEKLIVDRNSISEGELRQAWHHLNTVAIDQSNKNSQQANNFIK